jgi:hypothetical protein
MSNITITAQLHGTSMPAFSGCEKPALGGGVWRQRPVRQLLTVVDATGVSTIDNYTRVSEVEHRHT